MKMLIAEVSQTASSLTILRYQWFFHFLFWWKSIYTAKFLSGRDQQFSIYQNIYFLLLPHKDMDQLQSNFGWFRFQS